ncbi:CGNR zinc finger domain-containing protein [Streptomyces sp. NPDC005897]|uniref:CGNR zinc finger domain-containing protein n=1 Tax=Streptomyces sp. NPDC005897 TaxID=3157081 RepID=UPI0033E420A6
MGREERLDTGGATSSPRISLHDGRPHLHCSAADADPAAHVRAVTAAGLAYVICSADAERLGRCTRRDCAPAFVDTSRNGRRAYRSVRCANNDAVGPSPRPAPGKRDADDRT